MNRIDRDELKRKMEQGDDFVLIDVLDSEEYEASHLPGAINVPEGDDFAVNVQLAVPNKEQTVVVYCKDASCQASERAADELRRFGYREVRRYQGGKVEWKNAGLRVIETAAA